MSTLLILLEERPQAILQILFLLLISAIIGYVTAWLYAKFIFQEKRRELETEIKNLRAEKSSLISNLNEMSEEIEKISKENTRLQIINNERRIATESIIQKNAKIEYKLHQQDNALLEISKRKHLLDYSSFGMATAAEKDDLTMISGIGPFIEERLHAVDIYSFRQVSKFTAKDIEKINIAIEYFAGRIERDEWVAQAKELLLDKQVRLEALERIRNRKTRIYFNRIGIANKDQANDLTNISGIGGWIQEKLNALGIYTYNQIANFNDEDVQIVNETIEYFPGRIERDEWVQQAKELVVLEGKKSDLLTKLKAKQDVIAYNRIGLGKKHLANNLTLIKGISLWVEEKLNMLNIYSFEQISNFTPDDIKLISEILEIAPNRIQNDNWVEQAKGLLSTKPLPLFQ
jgi:predicted flap endonuclease-1-like 5' DNA nuclease